MLKGIIKNIENESENLILNKDIVLKLKANEQFFIDNSEGVSYKIDLIDNGKSIQIVFETQPKMVITLDNMVELISNSQSLIGIIDTKEGLKEFNQIVINNEFNSDNVIASLKEHLSKSSINENLKDGIIIDDFASLTNSIEATATGTDVKSNSSTFNNNELIAENENNILEGRSRLDESLSEGNQNVVDRDKMEELVEEKIIVKAQLSATSSVSEDGGVITYTVSLVDENGDAAVAKEDVKITLNNGETITIKAGDSTGTATTTINKDDVYKESDSISNSIKEVSGGESFEKLEADDTSVSTTISDDEDVVKAQLSATSSVSEDGGVITYTVSLVDENGDAAVAKEDVKITLNNGETITIKAGDSTGTATTTINKDDVYKESDSISNSIKEVSGGESFEKLEADDTSVSTTISDDEDVVSVKLSGDTSVTEGENAAYTVSLVDENGDAVIAKEDMEVKFTYTYTTASGEDIEEVKTVTIKAGESEASFEVGTVDNVYKEDDESFKITINSISNTDAFEKITIDSTPVETTISDDVDNVNVNLVASGEEREYTTEKVVNIGFDPQITALKDGGYIVTWYAKNSEGKFSLFLQQYNANGEKIGDTGELEGAKSDTAKIVILEDGGYILSCAHYGYGTYVQQFNSDGSKAGDAIGFGSDISRIDITLLANGGCAVVGVKANGEIFIQQFDADGVKVGEIEIINSNTSYSTAKITELNDGGYVVAWSGIDSQGDFSIFVQQFNSDGSKAGEAVQLEALDNTTGNDTSPQIETLEDGSYIVTWSGVDSQGDSSIFVQQFNSDGSKAGEAVQLEALDNTAGNDTSPQITILANGGYVITWSGGDSQGDSSIFVQQFNSNGDKVGETVQLEAVDNNMGTDQLPQIIALKDGSYVVTWQGKDAGGDWSIFVQKFNPDGTIDGENVKLESIGNTTGFDINPQITVLADGSYIVTWEGSASSERPIYTQKFNADGSMVIEEGDTISEGETATYEVTLTDDDGNAVIAKEDMVVTFKYTFTTLDGKNIEKVGTVTIKAGESSTSIDIKTLDDVYAEDAEKFYIEIVSITNADQFEKVTIDEIGVETIIKDDTPSDNVNVNLVASGEEREYTKESVGKGSYVDVLSLPDGSYAMTWIVKNSDGKWNTVTQKFDSDGNKVGEAITFDEGVNKSFQSNPTIESFADGTYIITWYGEGTNGSYSLYTQRFNTDGSKLGDIIETNTPTIYTNETTLSYPNAYQNVVTFPDGSFTIVWKNSLSYTDGSIYLQKYNADGTVSGDVVSLDSAKWEYDPKIVTLADGSYAVSWWGHDSEGDMSIFVQQFNSDGSKVGEVIQLEGINKTDGDDKNHQMESLSDGSYVVTWYGENEQGTWSCFTQKFNSDGTLSGSIIELEAPNLTTNFKVPEIVELADGSYVVSWWGQDADTGIINFYIQKFNSDGTRSEDTIIVETSATYSSDAVPYITALLDGSFVLSYYSKGSIFVQQFNADGTPANELVELKGMDKDFIIITLADGSYLITSSGNWTEKDIYTQKFNADGSMVIEEGDTISEGETATYEVTLTDDDGNAVIAKEDMVVTFKYTFTTLDGKNIEKVGTVTIKAGESSTSIDIKTLDDVYAEDAEKFYIEIVSITNADQFEKVTIDEIGVETIIKDDTPGDTVNIKLSGDLTVEEGNSATYKVTLTDENGKAVIAKEDMEVKFTYTYTTASGEDITEIKTVTIKAGESEACFEVETVDNVYKESDEKFEISIDSVTNTDQFEKVAIDDSSVETTITDDVDNLNVKIEGVKTNVIEGENATYKVTLTDDNGNPIVALEDMTVSVKYTYKDPTTNEDIVEIKEVTIPKGATEVDFEVEIVNDNYLVEPDSTGDVTLINTGHGSGNQSAPIITKLDNGDVLYVWGDNTSSNTSNYLKGKIYDAFGNVKVDTFTISDKSVSELNGDYWIVKGLDIKVMDNGNIIIGYAGYDGSQKPIMTVIDPSKDSSSSEFFVNKDVSIQQNDTTTHESAPIFTVLSDGRLLAVYAKNVGGGTNATVYGRIFDADGNAVSDEFRIGNSKVDQTTWGNYEQNIYVEELSSGKVVVGIANEYTSGNHKPVINIIDPSKNPTDNDFKVANDVNVQGQDNPGYESAPKIVELEGGKFMTVWYGGAGYDNAGGYRKLYARIFNEDGTAAGDQFVLTQNSIDGWNVINVPIFNLETLSNGNIVIGWVRNSDNPGNDAPMIAIIDPSSGKVISGSEMQINTSVVSGQTYAGPPIIKALGDGNFVAVWHDQSNLDTAIYYRIFDGNGNPTSEQIRVNPNGGGSLLDSVDNLAWDSISVEVTDDNSFIIGWVGNDSSSLDGSGTSVVSVTVDLGKNEGENHFEVSIDNVVSGSDGYEKVVVDDNAVNTTINEPDNMYLDQVINLSNFINDSTQPTTNEIDLTNNTLDSIIIKDESVEDLTNNQHLLKIFGDESKEDRVKLEGNWEKSNTQETINGEKFNVYQNGNSNIKILIDEDISVDPTI
ncbi:hypothetical protein CRU99_07145 [Malaciobacter mytili]|uniref:immunoglobulin-like domain-containing protein n=1 Tax=Malaciobacter mytili TaxID=603050 RepID=UPI00100BF007|nr:immunoglobulin-like domain-containing protein [Malaciobacter mytili]RXI43520.1 hypothetical protein CRU99_07145 [Malaciobacter mytili]